MLVLNGGHQKPKNPYHRNVNSSSTEDPGVLTEFMSDVMTEVKEVMGIEGSPDSALGLGPVHSFDNLPPAQPGNEFMGSDHKSKCKAFLQWHEDMITWGGERRLTRQDSCGFESEYHMRHGIQHLVKAGQLEDAARILGTSLDLVRMRADRHLLSLYMSDSVTVVQAVSMANSHVDVSGIIAMRRFVNHRREQLLLNPDVVFQMAAQEPESSAVHQALLRIPFERLPYNLVWWTNRTQVPTACEATIRQRGRINAVTWCPASVRSGQPSRMAWGVGREIRVFDVMKEQMVLRLPDVGDGEGGQGGGGGAAVAELLGSKSQKDAKKRSTHGHRSVVLCLAFTSDGKKLASGGADMRVIIWCTETGVELNTFSLFSDAVVSVAFSGDGKYLTTSTRDSSVRVWDVVTGSSRQLQQALEEEWDEDEWEALQQAEMERQESSAERLKRRVSESSLLRSLSKDSQTALPAASTPPPPPPPPDPADAHRPKGPGGPCAMALDAAMAAMASRGKMEALQGGSQYLPTYIGHSSMATAIRLWHDPCMVSGQEATPPTTIVAPLGTEGSVKMAKFRPNDPSRITVLGVNGSKAWVWRVDTMPHVNEDGTSECSEVILLNVGPGCGRTVAISMNHQRVVAGTANGMVCIFDVPDSGPPSTPVAPAALANLPTPTERPGTTGSQKCWEEDALPQGGWARGEGGDAGGGEEGEDEGEEWIEELDPVCRFQAYFDAPVNSVRLSHCDRYLATGGDNSSLQDSSLQIFNVEDAIASMGAFQSEVKQSREVFESGHSLSEAEFRERAATARMCFKGGKVDDDDQPEVDFSYACGPVADGRSYVVAPCPEDGDELLLWQVEGDGEEVIRALDDAQGFKVLGLEIPRPMGACLPSGADDLGEPAKQPLRGHDDTVTDALFLAHDVLATCSSDGTVAVWKVQPGGGPDGPDPSARVVARAYIGQQLVRIAPRDLFPRRPAPLAVAPTSPNAVQLMTVEENAPRVAPALQLDSPKTAPESYTVLVEGQMRSVIALEFTISLPEPRAEKI